MSDTFVPIPRLRRANLFTHAPEPPACSELWEGAAVRQSGRLSVERSAPSDHQTVHSLTHSLTQPGAKRPPRDDQPAGIAADGTFEIVGAPPGTFVVCVGWYVALTAGSATSQQESFGTIRLREGESTTCNLDLSRLLPGEALPSKAGK